MCTRRQLLLALGDGRPERGSKRGSERGSKKGSEKGFDAEAPEGYEGGNEDCKHGFGGSGGGGGGDGSGGVETSVGDGGSECCDVCGLRAKGEGGVLTDLSRVAGLAIRAVVRMQGAFSLRQLEKVLRGSRERRVR